MAIVCRIQGAYIQCMYRYFVRLKVSPDRIRVRKDFEKPERKRRPESASVRHPVMIAEYWFLRKPTLRSTTRIYGIMIFAE